MFNKLTKFQKYLSNFLVEDNLSENLHKKIKRKLCFVQNFLLQYLPVFLLLLKIATFKSSILVFYVSL